MLSKDAQRGKVKCVVWDLDNTVWDGVLLEPGEVRLRTDVAHQIRRLDEVGILHSIASKNDRALAMTRLAQFGLAEYFLAPQISWNPKSNSIQRIAVALNIGTDALAFVDDQDFERAEVAHALPEVTVVDPAELATVVTRPEFRPRFVTDESRQRRELYRDGIRRQAAEHDFVGTSEEFLATLDMELTIMPARRDDLQRAEELTVRTNQLNSTGSAYTYEMLDALRTSPDHLLLVASLRDRFGSYGTIGLCLLEKGEETWRLLLLLVSCRVISRGVGTVLLNHAMSLARSAGVRLLADFVETGRNRMMYVTYAFAGFREISRNGERCILETDLSSIQPPPSYVRLLVPAGRAHS
jgi:FkbH-like protein